jgi:hypothetical protein
MTTPKSVPPVLYKYCSPDRADIIEGKRIRFTQPRKLNDPFEMIVQTKDLDPGILQATFEEAAVLCMSEDWDTILMWSHYADSNKGFVLGLDTSSPFFTDRAPMEVGSREDKAVIDNGTPLALAVTKKVQVMGIRT